MSSDIQYSLLRPQFAIWGAVKSEDPGGLGKGIVVTWRVEILLC